MILEKIKSKNTRNLLLSFVQALSVKQLVGLVLTQRKARLVLAARRGLSLIEIMIALTMTLIILGAMMTAFQTVSREMQSGRAMIELANRVRVLETTMRRDLSSLTVEPRPYTTTTPAGFFTISEGVGSDATFAADATKNVIGDVDDYLSMTIQSKGSMFRGRGPGGVIESPVAEVCYFAVWTDTDGNGVTNYADIQYDTPIQIRRRILLVYPQIPAASLPPAGSAWAVVVDFFQRNDISARIVPNPSGGFNIVPNRLEDLAIRSNRFGHGIDYGTGAYPPAVDRTLRDHGFSNSGFDIRLMANLSSSDDIVLTDVVGFDIKVFSPNAPVRKNATSNDFLVEPADAGFDAIVAANDPQQLHGNFGGFVNLGDHRTGLSGWFQGNGTGPSPPRYFDSWTPAYENDGIDQDNDGLVDEGTNGLDDAPAANGVDDSLERETAPPYLNPVRGIQIQVRVIERLTKQVHQTTIMQSFVPE